MGESLALQPNMADLTGALEVAGDAVLDSSTQLGYRGRGTQRAASQQRKSRVHDGVQGHRPGQRYQSAGLNGFTVHRRSDAAEQRQVQQHRRRQHALTARPVKAGLSGRVVQQQ